MSGLMRERVYTQHTISAGSKGQSSRPVKIGCPFDENHEESITERAQMFINMKYLFH